MAIYLKLSKRTTADNNLAEVLIRLANPRKGYDLHVKSGIFVTEDNFKGGEVKVNYRKLGNDVTYHEKQKQRLDDLTNLILTKERTEGDNVSKEWLIDIIKTFHTPVKEDKAKVEKKKRQKTIYVLFEEYLSSKQMSVSHYNGNRVLMRDLARFEGYIRATDRSRRGFTLDVDTITRRDIEDFRVYLRTEKELSEKYQKVFEKLLNDYPLVAGKGQRVLSERGNNTIVKLMKKLKTFFGWLNDTGITKNRPFDGVKVGSETFGTPFYLTIEERNQIMDFDFSFSRALETQRDIFVFQCMVGCRVSDLLKLTENNITDGILVYTPKKTKDEKDSTQARVPLSEKALELIDRHRGVDPKGRLFPFISSQKYNEAIKAIFTKVGITRFVEVRNAVTGEDELKPLNEVASSHIARRTFIGNAYLMVQDPNLIGKMSGHTDGSRAFSRYRNIEDDTLRSIIDKMG